MIGLKGHRSVGGCRASIYNAVGQDAIDALVAFIADYEQTAKPFVWRKREVAGSQLRNTIKNLCRSALEMIEVTTK